MGNRGHRHTLQKPVQLQRVRIPAEYKAAILSSSHDLLTLQPIGQLQPQLLVHHPAGGVDPCLVHLLPALLGDEKNPQQHQQIDHPRILRATPGMTITQITDQLGAQQDDQPADINPQQKQWHCGKRTVNQLITGEQFDVDPKAGLGRLEQQRNKHATDQTIAQRHAGVGHRNKDQRKGSDAQQDWQQQQDLTPDRPQECALLKQRDGSDIGTDDKAGTEQQRPDTQHRPIEQKARQAPAWLANPPDGVKRLFDVHQHQQRGNHQQRNTHTGQLPGLGRKLTQMALQRFATGRQKILEDERFNLPAHLIERRNGRQHGVGHRHDRHHRKQRGIGQRGRILDAIVFEKAAHQITNEVQKQIQLARHSISLTARGINA